VPKTVARSIDILPTLLDYSGLPSPAGLEGRSLRPAADGREMPDAPSYAESFYTQLELGWAPLYGWRTATHKFIDAPHAELYDLEQDASEKTNLIGQQGALADQMRRGLQSAVKKAVPASAAAESDPESAARLRSLGYVSGSPGATQSGPLRDPKDGIRFMPRLNRAMSATRVQPELAIKDLTSVIEEDPSILMARRTRAVAYAAAGRHDLAIADIRELEKISELTPDDEIMLGDNLRFTGQYPEAARVLERAVQGSPKAAQPLISLAEVRIAEKQYDVAAATLERALKLAPDQIEALRRLGDSRAAAIGHGRRRRQIRADPRARCDGCPCDDKARSRSDARRPERRCDPPVPRRRAARPEEWRRVTLLRGSARLDGRQQEALPYFERAIAADPKSTMALNGLGLTRLSLGDKAGAGAALKQSLRIDPSQKDIAQALAGIGR
jgi:tetratricopeptide (TPR) repeat protein